MTWTVNSTSPRGIPISPNSVASIASTRELSALAKLGIALGTEIEVADPAYGAGRAVLVKHSVTCVANAMIHINQLNGTTALTSNDANFGRRFGVSLAAARPGNYGWAMVYGAVPIKKAAVAVSPNVALYQSDTAGRITPTPEDGRQLLGVRSLNTTEVAAGVSTVVCQIAHPSVDINDSLVTPVLTWVTDGTDNTPTLTIDVPIGIMLENDDWEIEFYSDAGLTSLLDEATGTVSGTDAGDGDIDGTLGDALADGTVYARARVTRSGNPVTNWSNTASQVIDAEAEFSPGDFGADLKLWLEADDLATMFQSNAGTSAVTTDGESVGTWLDKSSNDFDLTSTADDGTRPVYNTSGGLHWVTFDGTDAMLRRLAATGVYAGGSHSLFVAVRGNPGTDRRFVAEGNSGSTNTIFAMLQSNSATASQLSLHYRANDGATNAILNNVNLQSGAWDNTDKVVGVTDSGSAIIPYLNQSAGSTHAYSRSGTYDQNRFSLGAILRTTAASFFAGRVYALVLVNRVLTTDEREDLITYLGAKAGLTI